MNKVLFVCIHNGARSQMAEELLRRLGGDRFEVESAGIEPGRINPFVVEVLKEDEGIDISGKAPRSVADLIAAGKVFDYVITVCDESSAERCPLVPARLARLHWSFEDPSRLTGTREEILAQTRVIKEKIRRRIEQWLDELNREPS